MQLISHAGMLILAYLIGAIPFGLIIVKLQTGNDIRHIESGRTGGTNVMRAAGFWAGAITATLDFFKGAIVVWIVRYFMPGHVWLEVLTPVAAIIGHNYSIFLLEKNARGALRLRGGAGGATCVGGSMGLWWLSVLIVMPAGLGVLYFVGYASLATISVAFISSIVFAIRAWLGISPWQYSIYGLLALLVMIYALRPNFKRLFQGNERIVGFRARHKKTAHSSSSS